MDRAVVDILKLYKNYALVEIKMKIIFIISGESEHYHKVHKYLNTKFTEIIIIILKQQSYVCLNPIFSVL